MNAPANQRIAVAIEGQPVDMAIKGQGALRIEWQGETLTVRQWAKSADIDRTVLVNRLKGGIPWPEVLGRKSLRRFRPAKVRRLRQREVAKLGPADLANLRERFEALLIQHPGGHWEIDPNKASEEPRLRVHGEALTTLQAAWLSGGKAIQKGDRLTAGCGRPWCVNPRHLRLQGHNERLRIRGVTRTLAQWAASAGLTVEQLLSRTKRGIRGVALLLPVKSSTHVAPYRRGSK